MAQSQTSYFSNTIQGIPQIGGPVDLYESRTDPQFAIGYRVQRQDGNEYVYSQFGATTGAGRLVSQDLSESSLVDTDNSIIAPASSQTTTDGTAGQKFLEVTVASISIDDFAGGYATITDDLGEGHTYRIRGNTATGDPAAGNIRIELYDKIVTSLDATSDLAITGQLYSNLEPATTTDTAASGVSIVAQDADDYGWVQTKGVAGILTDGTVVLGSGTIIGSVAGSVAPAVETDILQRIGTVIVVGDTTGFSQVLINLS